jgi:7-cyano-7-deazaguanine synthase
MQPEGALVLFSGGQDSTTTLAWALSRFDRVETIGFDYGQRHRVELDCRTAILEKVVGLKPLWAERLKQDHLLPLGVLGEVSETALTRDTAIAMDSSGLPNTFVPGRNIIFLTFAAAVAYRRGLKHLVTGVCETDYSGYPDCRDETIKSAAKTLSLAMDTHFDIHTPLMKLNKAQTWALAEQLGGKTLVDLTIEETVTCYNGDRTHRHDWGYGCGACPACDLRAKGYAKYAAA